MMSLRLDDSSDDLVTSQDRRMTLELVDGLMFKPDRDKSLSVVVKV